jgi:hypothetical protein
LTSIAQTSAASSGVLPNDAALPVHYQDDEVPEPPEETSEEDGDTSDHPTGEPATTAPEPAPPGPLAKEKGPRMRYEEVIYKDEHGNIIPKEELERLLSEQGENVEFRTVYETQTKILRPGEEPPKGARVVGNAGAGGEVPEYPVGQNPETEEKKAYRTG